MNGMEKIIKKTHKKGIKTYSCVGFNINWKDFLDFFSYPEPVEPLKTTSRSHRRTFKYENGRDSYFIKKYSYFNSHKLKDSVRGFLFQISGAKRQLIQSQRFKMAGLNVPFPWFVIEKKRGVKKQSLFITPFINAPRLSQVFYSESVSFKDKTVLFEKVVRDLNKIHQNGIFHRDANIKNMLVQNGKIIWCDLDDVVKSRILLFARGRFKDCFKVYRSVAGALISTGEWDEKGKNRVREIFESAYRGHSPNWKKIYIKTDKRYGLKLR